MSEKWKDRTLLRDLEDVVIPQEWNAEEENFKPYEGSANFEKLESALIDKLNTFISTAESLNSALKGAQNKDLTTLQNEITNQADSLETKIGQLESGIRGSNNRTLTTIQQKMEARLNEIRVAVEEWEVKVNFEQMMGPGHTNLTEILDAIQDVVSGIAALDFLVKEDLSFDEYNQLRTTALRRSELQFDEGGRLLTKIDGLESNVENVAIENVNIAPPSGIVTGESTLQDGDPPEPLTSYEPDCGYVDVANSLDSEGDLLIGGYEGQHRRISPGGSIGITIDKATKIYVRADGGSVNYDYMILVA